ncbi:MAG: putative toxin-antitoxin system toxin component, PIN family, partial [Desulfococcaceae bacterium]
MFGSHSGAGECAQPKKKFLRYVTHEERNRFLQAFLDKVEMVEPAVTFSICRDPKDNKFLGLAVSG